METSRRKGLLQQKTAVVRKSLDEISEESDEMLYMIQLYKKSDKSTIKGKVYYTLSTKARNVRDALDARRASDSSLVAPNREFVASVGGFGNMGYILKKEVLDNLHKHFRENPTLCNMLEEKTKGALNFVNESLMSLCKAVEKEYLKMGIATPDVKSEAKDYFVETPTEFPLDLRAKNTSHEYEVVTELAQRYINITSPITLPPNIEKEPKIGLDGLIEEVQANKGSYASDRASKIVNQREKIELLRDELALLMSEYDTHIAGTRLERQNKNLKKFYAFMSTQRYISEVALESFHFFERHTDVLKDTMARRKVAALVPKDRILDFVASFALSTVKKLSLESKETTDKIYRSPKYHHTNIRSLPGIIEHLCRVDPKGRVTIFRKGEPYKMDNYNLDKVFEESCKKNDININWLENIVLKGPPRILYYLRDVVKVEYT